MLTSILTNVVVALVAGAWVAYRVRPQGQSMVGTFKVLIMGPQPTVPK